eukprot:2757364-Rhodomonas_salina.2
MSGLMDLHDFSISSSERLAATSAGGCWRRPPSSEVVWKGVTLWPLVRCQARRPMRLHCTSSWRSVEVVQDVIAELYPNTGSVSPLAVSHDSVT